MASKNSKDEMKKKTNQPKPAENKDKKPSTSKSATDVFDEEEHRLFSLWFRAHEKVLSRTSKD